MLAQVVKYGDLEVEEEQKDGLAYCVALWVIPIFDRVPLSALRAHIAAESPSSTLELKEGCCLLISRAVADARLEFGVETFHERSHSLMKRRAVLLVPS